MLRPEYLGTRESDMTLNDWSLLIFGISALYYFIIYVTIFYKPTFMGFILLFFTWVAHVVINFIYGVSTGQIGFVFLSFLDIVMIVCVFIIMRKAFANENV